MLRGQHNPTFNTVYRAAYFRKRQFFGCLGFVINSTLNILSARGLAHSERQRNVKNVALRNAELHNTKKTIYFPTSKITSIKHPKNSFFCPVANRSFSARWARKTGCSLRGLSLCSRTALLQLPHTPTDPISVLFSGGGMPDELWRLCFELPLS